MARTATLLTIGALLVVSTACGRSAQIRTTPSDIPPARAEVVPAGTLAVAQMHQPLSTKRSQPGDRFTAELLDPLVDGEGREHVAKGTVIEGVVQDTRTSLVAGSGAALELGVLGVRAKGERVIPVQAEIANSPIALESAWGRSTLGFLAGAAAGAGTGLAIDSDNTAAVVSATVVGASLGALAAWLFGRRDAELPAGSIVTLRLTEDFAVAEKEEPVPGPRPASTTVTPCDCRSQAPRPPAASPRR